MRIKHIQVSITPQTEFHYIDLRIWLETSGDCHAIEKRVPIDHFQSLFRICMEEAIRHIEDELKLKPSTDLEDNL